MNKDVVSSLIHSSKKLKSYFFLIPVVIFSIVWIYVLITEMKAFNIDIFDYGISYNMLWREAFGVASYHSTVGYLSYYEPRKLISFLLIPYMMFFPSIYNLLILQVIVFAIPAIILYFLALNVIKSIYISLVVEILWILFYPNSAAISYPFHYQTLFPMFYILGFYLFYTGRPKLSSLSFALSAVTNLLAPIVLIFTIPSLILLNSSERENNMIMGKRELYMIILVMISVSFVVLIFNYWIGGAGYYVGQSIPNYSGGSIINILWKKFLEVSGYQGFLYILFMVFPLLFSVFIEWKFIPPAIPAMIYYLVGYSGGYLRFFYPMQYSVWVSGIVFVSFIFLIKHLNEPNLKHKGEEFKGSLRHFRKLIKDRKKVVSSLLLTALIVNSALFAVYSPLGPINQYLMLYPNANPPSNGGYGLYSSLNVSRYDTLLGQMENIVPRNATVLSQFNMPQFSNRYYFTYPGQYNPSTPIDYAINDPENTYFFLTPVGDTYPDYHPYNMMQLSNMFLMNSTYGVYAQSEGAILFKHNYTGKPVLYVPLFYNISMNRINTTTFSSPKEIISPGTYNFKIQSPTLTSVSLYFGSTLLSVFNSVNKNITIKIPTYSYSNFTAVTSPISFPLNISIRQIAPATHINIYRSPIAAPLVYKTFSANFTHFSPVVVNHIILNSDSFSYLYMINLTSYEDGRTITKKVGNDAQIFSLNGKYPYLWNQIENTGYLEYGLRTENAIISVYIQPVIIPVGTWLYVAEIFHDGYVALYIDGINIYSAQIFPEGTPIGNVDNLMIGGAHPFLSNGEISPNSNPLNASIADFVILNGTLSLGNLENPQNLLNNLQENPNVVFSGWVSRET